MTDTTQMTACRIVEINLGADDVEKARRFYESVSVLDGGAPCRDEVLEVPADGVVVHAQRDEIPMHALACRGRSGSCVPSHGAVFAFGSVTCRRRLDVTGLGQAERALADVGELVRNDRVETLLVPGAFTTLRRSCAAAVTQFGVGIGGVGAPCLCRREMQPGDVVVVPMSSRRAAIGTVPMWWSAAAVPQ